MNSRVRFGDRKEGVGSLHIAYQVPSFAAKEYSGGRGGGAGSARVEAWLGSLAGATAGMAVLAKVIMFWF